MEDELEQLLQAARANPLSLEEVVVRLGQALRHNLNYLAYRQLRKRQTAYDEVLEQELEAIASALLYLQRPSAQSLFCADCQRITDERWEQFQRDHPTP
jgi:hypothetical protein